MRTNNTMSTLGAAILGGCIALAGFFVYCGIDNLANRDRYVSVNGTAEREVSANRVTWTISTRVTGNSESAILPLVEQKKNDVVSHLKANGISNSEIASVSLFVTDRSELPDWDKRRSYMDRYEASYELVIVSTDVVKVRELSITKAELYKAGVEDGGCTPVFSYTTIGELKPELLQEATANARIVADRLAHDAHCSIGSMRSADQQIEEVGGDPLRPWMLKVRAHAKVEYMLK